ncbi:MAG: N-6 DNA methylase, partial [Candidatus Theseobacter exili]|nr:N-6 DNA methylase [Candidatus Theseobacter exili]
LHAKGEGRDKGAYYTPVHLVNFILDELDAKKPLKEGMKVFDPSCGSGAFLVQCYRRLVESVVRGKNTKLNPTDLRKLLVDHIFGLDADEEACQVAELSLSLTLLDYIEPRDLRTYPTFKLPDLHKNIFHCAGGFFDEGSLWANSIPKDGYDWIVGNPPWKNIGKQKDKEPYHRKAIEWIDANKNLFPVDNYQIAEAFAWKISQLLKEDGQCGLLMPAKTLFKKQGDKFRTKFFSEIETWCIVNFANIRRYLFEGADNPAAAFFYSGKSNWDKSDHYITTYAPFAVEQDSQLNQTARSKKIWSVCVNYSTIKEIPLKNISDGSSMPWKIAMWGTHRDELFIRKICRNHILLESFIKQETLFKSEGLQLRFPTKTDKNFELVNEVQGEKKLLMNMLRGINCIHSFNDDNFFETLSDDENIYTRKGRKELPLSVCKPPHIFVDASRRFIVYSDKFFIIPPRQIGIAGNRKQKKLLKALALYFKSDFVTYQQCLTSASWGIERDNSNMDDLDKLPIPLSDLSDDDIAEWAKLHDEIVEADKKHRSAKNDKQLKEQTLWDTQKNILPKPDDSLPKLGPLLKQMNKKVYKLLSISKKQRWLIEDMLDVRKKLNDGKIAKEAIELASEEEIDEFANIFQEELDLFLDHSGKRKVHKVKVLYTRNSAVIIVDHLMQSTTTKPKVFEVNDSKTRRELNTLQEKLTETKSQWMYFTRCLRIYEDRKTYIFKPRQRLYWLKSQALAEADDFIAEKLATE